MMEKYFATYNQSLALKELGFDEPCFAGYRDSEWIGTDGPNSRYFHAQLFSNHQFDNDQKEYCSAPLKSQVFEWFRENHNLYHSINPLGYNMCLALIGELGKLKSCNVPEYGNYEEAESACIDKLIEITRNV